MATNSSILAWRIPWTEEPDGLQPMGSQRVRHTEQLTLLLYTENPKDASRKLLEPINTFGKVVLYKINTFLYTYYKKSKRN